ncbi:uncharacterized protein LOC114360366 isoform X1 [Ostrinia furnacalis]|uniref:uncharacterized protein LOC114360366 isoform X1 n=1 Tax=Ostrinia furnacalis TaxID=93504 RepID=UPI0010394A96|nr:uncharacterized protein LOC114360366 isoform X1 [Ostrinia furnacalis]
MSLNPLNELKRRLDDHDTPLPKRLCLARNLIKSHHFPSAPKERIVADWLHMLMQKNELSREDLRNVIDWLNVVDDVTSELKSKIIQIVSQYFNCNPIQKEDVQSLLSFLENPKLSSQLGFHTEEWLSIAMTLLEYFKAEDSESSLPLSQRVFNNIVKFYKESKKKLEFILKLLDEQNLQTIFSYLDLDRSTVIAVCGSILFPMNKKSFFGSYLQTLVRKDNINDLLAEKGDNIQSVIKIMDAFFSFPKGNDQKFLTDFIDIFVSCYYTEAQLIFAFYIMVANSLKMEQNYLTPAMTMTPIAFEENSEKIVRNIFRNMLETVLRNEVDINVRLSDTLGVKIPKVETQKTFLVFLEAVMLGQLKMDNKPDKATFQIIKTALKLDPALIEPKMKEILPPIMTAKKSNTSNLESYTEMLNCLLEILFKLSRGTTFVNQILPMVKSHLEASNTDQTDLIQKLRNDSENEKIKNKITNGSDVFPKESIELYGKLTCELMFRQNKDLLASLQKDFEDHCLATLEEKTVSPSTITLTEVMSAILCSFLRHNKMADHTVPLNIAQDFWAAFKHFEVDILKRFGECVLEFNNEPQLTQSFLKLCISCSQLKLFNIKYSNVKTEILSDFTSEVFDLSAMLPCLTVEQWTALASNVDDEGSLLLEELLLIKTMVIQTVQRNAETSQELILPTKTHLIKQLSKNLPKCETSEYISKVLFNQLDKNQAKQVAKIVVKLSLKNSNFEIFNNETVSNSRPILNALVLETIKQMCKCFDNTEDLTKVLNKTDFDMGSFTKDRNMKEFFNQLTISEECKDENTLPNCVEILKHLKIYYLEESYQLVTLLMLLAAKNNAQKKLRRSIDHLLQSIFELSECSPDLYKIFPVEYIFSFKDRLLLDLLTLKIKVSNNMCVIKSLVDSAVKRVRMEKEIITKIVELLLKKQSKSSDKGIEFFSDPAFQISCALLPSLVKQKRIFKQSAPRTILADFQEKIHKSLLECFKNINFSDFSNISMDKTGNIDESMVVSENTAATLNAIAAYSLTLSKYCETTDKEEMKNLDYLWPGLEFFVQNAINALQNPDSKHQHVESSIQLLNVVLRYIKKLEAHDIFQTKDKLFLQIWNSIKTRLSMVLSQDSSTHVNVAFLEDISVNLRYICELVSVEVFTVNFVGDLNKLAQYENPSKLLKNEEQIKTILTSHKVSKYLWAQILKANIVGPKCVAISKSIHQISRNLKIYIQQHYDADQSGVVIKSKKKKMTVEFQNEDAVLKTVKVDEKICEMIHIYLEILSEAALSAKKVSLDYKSLDAIFELLHFVDHVLSLRVPWAGFHRLFEGSIAVLNGLLVSREELLEDRWPCFMQCYRSLGVRLCAAESSAQLSLGPLAHSLEKLTQAICKRKTHVSKIAAYTVGDLCSAIERCVPSRTVRQHLENSVSLLIQASDTAHAMAFLRRALTGSPGQMTMTNMYTMYKRYHKYVGNA